MGAYTELDLANYGKSSPAPLTAAAFTEVETEPATTSAEVATATEVFAEPTTPGVASPDPATAALQLG